MEGLVLFLVIVAALVAVDIASLLRGVDSRDGSTDPRAPLHPTGLTVG